MRLSAVLRPPSRPPIRRVNDHLANAVQAAKEANNPKLAERLRKVWRDVAAECAKLEGHPGLDGFDNPEKSTQAA